jgi:putative heme iron utilization protein
MTDNNNNKFEENQTIRIQHEFKKYITTKQSLMMATVDNDGLPDVSYAPFIMDEDFNVYVFVSDIVKRTQNLLANGRVSLLFVEDEAKAKHIFARKRVTMQANATTVTADDSQIPDLKKLFEDKFGEFVNLEIISKSDFHLIRMKPYEGGLTKGFGLAFKLTGDKLANVEHLKEGHKVKKQEEQQDGAA